MTLGRPVNVGVTVISNWSGFSIVTKEMGRAWSSPVFNYYTRITSPMTLLTSSPTVRGFTANNLRGLVGYLRCLLSAACAPDRTQLRGNGLLDGSLGERRGVHGGSHGSVCFETGPAAC